MFGFYHGNRPCNGFREALQRYRELVPGIKLAGWHEMSCHLQLGKLMIIAIWVHAISSVVGAGPTSSAPIIETGMSIVDESGGQYHVLLIIADWQVCLATNPTTWIWTLWWKISPLVRLGDRSIDVEIGHCSPQEEDTIAAMVEAWWAFLKDHDQDRLSATLQITADRIHQ